MKKSLLIFLLALLGSTFSLLAQTTSTTPDITSKKGEKFLPEAGDWAIGADANPFLNYIGNFFGKTANNSFGGFLFPNSDMIIQGKYFTDATTAYRGGIRIGLNSSKATEMVDSRSVTTAPVFPALPAMVENDWKSSSTNIGLTGGMEKHMGSGRLQGYYGAEAGIGFNSSTDKFTYGNALNPTGTPPVLVDETNDAFTGSGNITTDTYGNAARITERKNGASFDFGIRGFVGVQYFILPKISLGGEFGWGLAISTVGKKTTTTESIGNNGTTQVVGSQSIDSGKGSSFGVDTDNKNSIFGNVAAVVIMFHFH